jgi:hypothetical protein
MNKLDKNLKEIEEITFPNLDEALETKFELNEITSLP